MAEQMGKAPKENGARGPQITKNQHFVPRFLLKHFASTSESKVNAFDSKRGIMRLGVPVDNVLSRNYFYDRTNEIEKLLEKAEQSAAPLFREVMNERRLVQDDKAEHILRFLLIQNVRTPSARDEGKIWIRQAAESFARDLLQKNGFDEREVERVRFEIDPTFITARMLLDAWYAWPLLLDLEWHLLVNKTSLPFLLGDHPVVGYNWYLRDSTALGATSITARGAQFIMPLSGSQALYLCDKETYEVEGGEDFALTIADEADVRLLNELQFRHRESVIVFPDHSQEQYVRSSCSAFPPNSLFQLESAMWDVPTGGLEPSRTRQAIWRRQTHIQRWLSFVCTLDPGPDDKAVICHRNPDVVAEHERFMKQLGRPNDTDPMIPSEPSSW